MCDDSTYYTNDDVGDGILQTDFKVTQYTKADIHTNNHCCIKAFVV